MKKITTFTFLITVFIFSILLNASLFAQPAMMKYHKIRVYFDEKFSYHDAISFHITSEALKLDTNLFIEAILNDRELESVKQKNARIDIIIDDMTKYYQDRNSIISKANNIILSNDKNFTFGSMAGYFTIDELHRQYDTMKIKYPQFMLSADTIGRTGENRPIIAYHIGTTSNDSIPEVLFDALHHARECSGPMALTYFLKDLLSKANDGNEEALYFMRNRSIYVIPYMNPDGLAFNIENYPSGGGMWRKNRRDLGNSQFGVDLNRNYGPQNFWDAPNDGSSTDPSDDTYRGSAPFSEPETQAIRDFCESHHFVIDLDYHTFGNHIIYPWAALPYDTPDSIYYRNLGMAMVEKNNYALGRCIQLLGYETRGGSFDWLYQPTDVKPKMFTFTTEIGKGSDGFWAPLDRQYPQCLETLFMQYQVLWSAKVNLRPFDVYSERDSIAKATTLYLTIRNVGVADAKTISLLTVNSLDNNITINESQQNIPALKTDGEKLFSFNIPLPDNNYVNGTIVPVEVAVIQDGVTRRDTFNVRFWQPKISDLYTDGGLVGDWNRGKWANQWDNDFKEYVLTDSWNSTYINQDANYVTMKSPVHLSGKAALVFMSHWQTESESDWTVVQVSSNNGLTWNYLRSTKMITNEGSNDSIVNLIPYGLTGSMPVWIRQECSLDNYTGKDILIRFGMISDPGTTMDGCYLKDIRIKDFPPVDFTDFRDDSNIKAYTHCYPNPATRGQKLFVQIDSGEYFNNSVNISLTDLFGRVVYTDRVSTNESVNNYAIPTYQLQAGYYNLMITDGHKTRVEKVIIND